VRFPNVTHLAVGDPLDFLDLVREASATPDVEVRPLLTVWGEGNASTT
jgi:hypothetical protein